MKLLTFFIFAAVFALAICVDEAPPQVTNSQICKMCIRFITKMSNQILEHEGDVKKVGSRLC